MAAAPLTWEYESEYRARGTVCGCDEAGRGPLAGPVYAAAVILPDGAVIDGLNDSEKLSAKQREAVRGRILETALDSAVAFATVEEIETLNILGASLLAMRRAVEALRVRPALLLIDGSVARGFAQPAVAVVGGDAKVPLDRGRVGAGEGRARRVLRRGRRAVPAVRLRAAQGLRHQGAPGSPAPLRPLSAAPAKFSEKAMGEGMKRSRIGRLGEDIAEQYLKRTDTASSPATTSSRAAN